MSYTNKFYNINWNFLVEINLYNFLNHIKNYLFLNFIK